MSEPFRYSPYSNPHAGSIASLLLRPGEIAADQARSVAAAQADAARTVGNALAQSQAARGDIWGRAFQNVGNVAAGAVQQWQEQHSPEAKQRREIASQQQQINQARIDEATAAKQQSAILSDAYRQAYDPATGKVDRGKFRGFLTQNGLGAALPDIEKGLDDTEAAAFKAKEAKTSLEQAELGYAKTLAGHILASEFNPMIVNGVLTAAELEGHDVTQFRQLYEQQPEQFKTFVTNLVTPAKPKPDYTVNGVRVSGETNQPLYTAPAKPPVLGSPEDVLTRYATEHGTTPDKLTVQQIGEAHKLANPSVQPSGSGAGAGSGLNDDAVDYTATQYRILGPSGIPTRIEGPDRVKILNAAARQAKQLGQSPAQAVQKQSAYKADSAALSKMTQMASAAEAFETKALAQADLIDQLSEKVGRTNWPMVNGLVLAGKIGTGDTPAQLLANAIIGFQSEYAKILEGSTGSVAAVGEGSAKRANQMISQALSKGTLKDTVSQMRWEMRQTMNGYDATIAHITERMGGVPSGAQSAPAGAVPDLTGLAKGLQRRFQDGPFAGQVWTLGPDGKPKKL